MRGTPLLSRHRLNLVSSEGERPITTRVSATDTANATEENAISTPVADGGGSAAGGAAGEGRYGYGGWGGGSVGGGQGNSGGRAGRYSGVSCQGGNLGGGMLGVGWGSGGGAGGALGLGGCDGEDGGDDGGAGGGPSGFTSRLDSGGHHGHSWQWHISQWPWLSETCANESMDVSAAAMLRQHAHTRAEASAARTNVSGLHHSLHSMTGLSFPSRGMHARTALSKA